MSRRLKVLGPANDSVPEDELPGRIINMTSVEFSLLVDAMVALRDGMSK